LRGANGRRGRSRAVGFCRAVRLAPFLRDQNLMPSSSIAASISAYSFATRFFRSSGLIHSAESLPTACSFFVYSSEFIASLTTLFSALMIGLGVLAGAHR